LNTRSAWHSGVGNTRSAADRRNCATPDPAVPRRGQVEVEAPDALMSTVSSPEVPAPSRNGIVEPWRRLPEINSMRAVIVFAG
jgi:hypothetical protein